MKTKLDTKLTPLKRFLILREKGLVPKVAQLLLKLAQIDQKLSNISKKKSNSFPKFFAN